MFQHQFRNLMLGQEHWDTCSEAGPNERPSTPFALQMPSLSLLTFDGQKLQLFGCNSRQYCFNGCCGRLAPIQSNIKRSVPSSKLTRGPVEAAKPAECHAPWKVSELGQGGGELQRKQKFECAGVDCPTSISAWGK